MLLRCLPWYSLQKATALIRLRSIRSRRIIPVHTRLSIWKTCVLSSALHGLHALKLSSADTHKLSQWYHRQVRAITRTPAHITKISNQELRNNYGLETPVQILYQRAENKLRKLQAKPSPDVTSTRQALAAWEDKVARYKQQQCMAEAKIMAVGSSNLERAQSCPECGLYFSSIKTVRQRVKRGSENARANQAPANQKTGGASQKTGTRESENRGGANQKPRRASQKRGRRE